VGICGIPSLWVSKEELFQKQHITRDQTEEAERLTLMLKILQAHKKYENDKYFGGSIFKRGGNGAGAAVNTINGTHGIHYQGLSSI
jgi:hypothetical protein